MAHTTKILNHEIGVYGYGLMGFTWRKDPPATAQAFAAMRTALSEGANFWNGGEFYGPPERNSLVLLREYFTRYPEDADKVLVSIKGGMVPGKMMPDGRAQNVRRSVEDCLSQLGGTKSRIDIFECARVDPKIPIEETMGALATLVSEGKIGGISLSEVSASTIERAAGIHAIAAVEVEMSLWAPDILSNGVAVACARHAIPIVAYSPLGRGALTAQHYRTNADIPDGDHRKHMPKYQDDTLAVNNLLVDEVAKVAERKGVTMPQVALAWVRGFSGREIEHGNGAKVRLGQIIPIPGATTSERVQENIRPDIVLTEDEMLEFDEILKKFPTKGGRYPKEHDALLEG